MEFKPIEVEDQDILMSYFEKREVLSCEYCFVTLFLWNNRYNVTYYKTDDYILFMENYKGRIYSIMPLCEEANFKPAFEALRNHFKEINLPFIMLVADEKFKDFVESNYPGEYEIKTNRDQYDYLYDAHLMRTLEGKKMRKKRNHVNGFLKEFEGRWHYSEIETSQESLICDFMQEWAEMKDESAEMLDDEMTGICHIIENLSDLNVKIGGIFIDNKLRAFTIGSVSNKGKEALIHVEKADPNVRGLYQMINQQFLINTFPDVELVNREDDVGIEGLRKAKMSYYPIGFAKKYNIFEKGQATKDGI